MIYHIVCGAGYVGLPLATYLKSIGENVAITDIDESKLELIHKGINPIDEPIDDDLPRVTHTYNADIYWVCVPTPSGCHSTDLTFVTSCIAKIKQFSPDALIVIKSTITQKDFNMLCLQYKNLAFSPEFLVQGIAYNCIKNNDRKYVTNVDHPLIEYLSTILDYEICDAETLASVKTMANNLLATRLQIINTYALTTWKQLVLERDYRPAVANRMIKSMLRLVGADDRIGHKYLSASIGYGGSCLNKDLFNASANLESSSHMYSMYVANELNIKQWALYLEQWIVVQRRKGYAYDKVVLLGSGFSDISSDTRNSPTYMLQKELVQLLHIPVEVSDEIEVSNTLFINVRNKRAIPDLPNFIDLVF